MLKSLGVRAVDALRPKAKPYSVRVDSGLYIRVAPDGEKRWLVRASVGGTTQDFWLPKPYGNGSETYLSLARAKSECDRIKGLAKLGIDERDRIKQEQQLAIQIAEQEKRNNLTVQDLFDAWIGQGVNRKDGNKELRRVFERDILPVVGIKYVRDLSEETLITLLKNTVKEGTIRKAQVMLLNLKQMFAWGEGRQPWRSLLVEGNPAQTINESIILPHDYEEIRTRVLSASELKELGNIFITMTSAYEAAPNKYSTERPLAEIYQSALWISLGTTCRMGELLMTEWSDVDLEHRTWFIPKENVKGARGKKRDQTIYLSDFVLSQFKRIKALQKSKKWVFPNREDSGHVIENIVGKLVGDRQLRFKNRIELKNRINSNSLVLADGVNGNWTPHDMRRTAATIMFKELKINPTIINECQNHDTRSQVDKHYLQYDYAEEKKEAWLKLGQWLQILLTESNISHMKVAA